MDFFNILKCSVFFLLIKLQEEFPPVKYHLCWICTSNKNKALKTINFCFSVIFWNLLWSKFWNHFQAEIIPWNPMFLHFLTVFHMVWKNKESYESWLVGFWVRHSKMTKISVDNFFCFWTAIMDLLIILKYQILFFSNIIPTGVSTCKILTF